MYGRHAALASGIHDAVRSNDNQNPKTWSDTEFHKAPTDQAR